MTQIAKRSIAQLSTSPHQNAGELLARKSFSDNLTFQNRKIGKSGKSGKSLPQIRFYRGIFCPIFQNQEILLFCFSKTEIFFRKSENLQKCGRNCRKSWKCERCRRRSKMRETCWKCESLPCDAGELTAMSICQARPNQSN